METIQSPRMHVSLHVKDINQTINFYQTFFNQAADKVKPGYAKFVLKEPALVISFVEDGKPAYGFGHLGFQVATEDELKTSFERIKKAGLGTLEENQVSCCYALQDKFWVSDPDGYKWEMYHLLEDVEINDPQYTTEKESACCTPASGCC